MKKLLLLIFFVHAFIGLYAQTYTVYTSEWPRSTYHASPDCPKLKGNPVKREINFSNDLNRSDRKLVKTYYTCSKCKPVNLALIQRGNIVSFEDSIDIEGAIAIMPQDTITSSNVICSQHVLFFVHDALDNDLIGCPVVCKIVQVRKSNISGSEGRMVIRPLYIDKKGEKIKVYGDIHIRGLNRSNVKFWLGFLPPMLFIPGTGAKIYPTDQFTIYLR